MAGGVPVWVDGTTFDSTPRPPGDYGLKLTGLLPGAPATGDYVSLGPAPALGAKKFTLEAWIKRTAGGTPTATGGALPALLSAIPLITKGMAEADGSNVDANYFFGINQADGKLAADFEDMATGANHRGFGLDDDCPRQCVASRGRHLRRRQLAVLSRRHARWSPDGGGQHLRPAL